MSDIHTDIIIIGAGPVGLFAVFKAGMLGMKCHVVDALPEIGGQCSALYPEKPIYDIPSRPVVSAGDLIADLQKQAAPFSPIYHLNTRVDSLEKTSSGWQIFTNTGKTMKAKAVIIAAGVGTFVHNRPPLENIDQYEDSSIFYVVRDKSRFEGQDVLIGGGGDSAVDWAIALHGIAKSISVVHRRDKFRAMPDSVAKMKDLAIQNPETFKIYTPYQITSLQGGSGKLESVTLSTLDGETKDIHADSFIALYGLKTELGPIASWDLDLDDHTIRVTQSSCETSKEALYAVGDIAAYEGKVKLILSGFSEVASACYHAYQYVFPGKALHFEYSTSRGIGE